MILSISSGCVSFWSHHDVVAHNPVVLNSFEYNRYLTSDMESSGSFRISDKMKILGL